MVKKAVYYGRVSTAEQADSGYSLDMQKDKCTKWAQEHDYEIVEYFEDRGKSGSNYKELKELQKLHNYISLNNVDSIICWRLDRLGRYDVEFYIHTMKKIDDLGMSICIAEYGLDTNTMPRVVLAMQMGLATDEVKTIKKRTKDTMLFRAQQGFYMGKAPIGYINTQVNGNGLLVVNTEIAPFIYRAFSLYATGNYTMQAVANELHKQGFSKNEKPYPVRKIEHILKNITYTGLMKYGKNDDGSDRILQGVHEAIVPMQLFKDVQAVLKYGGKPNTKHTEFIYSKFIKCTCGCYLSPSTTKGAHNSGNYIYYRCHNKDKIHKHIKSVKQDDISRHINNIFSEIKIPEFVLKNIKPKLVNALDEFYKTEKQALEVQTRRLHEIEKAILKTHEERVLGECKLSDSDYNKQMTGWEEEKQLLNENIQSISIISKNIYNNLNTLMKFLNNIDDTYKNADIPNKQRLLRMTFEEATYDTETEVLRLKLKPIFQALRILKDNAETHSKKVATQSKVSNEELLQILSKNIEISLKNEVTTLKKLSIIEKEPTNETLSVNGAGSGGRTHEYRNHNPGP